MYECVYVNTFIELIIGKDETEQRQSDRESMKKKIAKETGGKDKRDLPTSRCGVCVCVCVFVCLFVRSRTLAFFRDKRGGGVFSDDKNRAVPKHSRDAMNLVSV